MDKFGTGTLVTRLTTDVTNLQNMYQNVIRSMVRSPLMLISGTVMACFINKELALIFFVTVPFLAILLAFIAVTAYPRFKLMFEKYDLMNTIVQENLIAIRVVKAFVRGNFESKKFEKIAGQVRDAQVKAEKIVITNGPVMQLTIYMCICAALWFGGNKVLAGKMRTGELISFLTYITQILMSLMMLSMMFVQFILSRASITRVCEVLDSPSGEQERFDSNLVKDFSNSIEFDHVYFSYDGRIENCVLSDICLKIPSGATVGIIGGTGSSKTTLVSLIPRLYDCLSGAVKVGGIDVKKIDLESLRKSIGVVLQKNVLFSGTIAENLRWGNENATQADLIQACIAADAHDFVSSFPNGYDTVLEQGGVNLSGGQKQRLCLARALVKKPSILILDDSTSAVDTATDSRIQKSLKECLSGTTKIIIAQRINSVQNADIIVVLDEGKINGIGTHQKLIAENKIYREVYDSQLGQN